jgi:hypothetical protein
MVKPRDSVEWRLICRSCPDRRRHYSRQDRTNGKAFESSAPRHVMQCTARLMLLYLYVKLLILRSDDSTLSPVCLPQATRTGPGQRGLGIATMWINPMRRTRETANCITSVTGLAVPPHLTRTPALRGGVSGGPFRALRAMHPGRRTNQGLTSWSTTKPAFS